MLERYPEIWIYIIGAVVVFAVFIVFFPKNEQEQDSTNTVQKVSWTLYVLTDDNGCQYLGDGNGLTPRMDTDGKQICTFSKDVIND